MSRTPRALAQRIDRLARHAHAFHRFAHHPLCARYSGEVMALGGRRRVCRGCLAAAVGLAIGSSVGFCVPLRTGTELLLVGLATWLCLISLKLRLPKLAVRCLPAALASAAVTAAARRALVGDAGATIVVATGLLLAACVTFVYRWRGPNRAACVNCPERLKSRPCSGVAPIIRRERAFQRLSQRWLDAAAK